ncbi:Mitochondrial escape protein-like protein [Emericellopsis cladophorae]|uniref:Mitochondrial escape protein 2 n=1 Tax=Emericellopsis cladophorae TaxID=2686198 RepID=A0A9Q0BC72_9HYPO|nr:Mitochondrial escape protein-like protein [Emericellopsis cladophorae]KAI6778804.1 Mitochondrial escape protein-like protein [Emericellopsis cladophorae]
MFRLRLPVATLALRPGVPSHQAIRPLLASTRQRVKHGAVVRKVWESTSPIIDEKDKDDGHIGVKPNETIIFFDNLFPLKLSSILNRVWKTDRDMAQVLQRFETSSLGIMDPIRLVKNAIPKDMQLRATEILPRLKDGGAFVKFEHSAALDVGSTEETLINKLNDRPIKPWFSPFRGIKAHLVRGTPWLEDLYRYPSNLVKIEFVAPEPGAEPMELSEEKLYTLFRRYGKIADIIPQAQDNKATPRFAYLAFPMMRDAIMARNCMHGFVVGEALGGGKMGTRLRMSYEKRVKAHSIWNWLTNHPRIVVPAIAALIAGISVIVFDPIRQFFIELHIQHSLRFTESRVYKWFKSQTDQLNITKKSSPHDDLSAVWNHRRDLIDQLRSWLDGSSDTFIVVTGPKGSGKKEMVMDQSLEGRKDVLTIDCRPIVEARGEAGTIRRLAAAVGYRPIFSWANSMSSMIDLAVQSTTGVKAGFSETLESQLNKILYTTTAALKKVSLSGRSKRDKDANLSDDAYLESHPERRPVIVIDNFLHKSEDKGIVYEKVAEWAASVVQNNIAHVIFLTNDSSYTKSLAKALPDRVIRSVSLGDLDPDVAKNFVMSRLDEEAAADEKEKKKEKRDGEEVKPTKLDLAGLDESIETMGGRLTDLEFLTRRIKTGQTPKQAVDEIVNETASEIVKMFLLGKASGEERKWSTQQAWVLVKSLAKEPTLRYHQVLLSPAFTSSMTQSAKDGETALESLTNSELIAVQYTRGRPTTITAGKPLNQAAFSVLQNDRVLRAKMDLAVLTENAKVEAQSIDKYEKELSLLGGLPKQTNETTSRINYLLGKMNSSQDKIVQFDSEMSDLKKILNKEY